MAKYRKKPVEIEAERASVLIYGFGQDWKSLPDWAAEAYKNGTIVAITAHSFTIKTLEGDHIAVHSDMIIQGVDGELYPCKPEIFAKTYDLVES